MLTRTRTTCELYYAVQPLELLPSVQSALYYWLHHVFTNSNKGSNRNRDRNNSNFNLRSKVKDSIKNIYLSYKYQLKRRAKCDVIFNFFIPSAHGLGIQRKLAEQCHAQGLRTGIIDNGYFLNLPEFNDIFSLPNSLGISASNIPSKIHQEIIEQCKHIEAWLEKLHVLDPNSEEYLSLANLALQIEQKAIMLQHLLEIKSPKLVILAHGKYLDDAAMQIACHNTDTLSMLIPHGFPQRSLSPLAASFVMSCCPHHDDYLKKISLPSSQIKKLGWIEPTVTLTHSLYNSSTRKSLEEKYIAQETEKYNILFLSSLSGWERHRCDSLLESIPDILKALSKMPEVETINFRLRPSEYNDLVIKTLLTACGGSKLRISGNSPIEEDLKACDVVMSFNSTALLYGPYLNKRAVEIRNPAINSIWGDTVLPSEQVYQIGEEFKPDEFREFVLNSPILKREEVFYNWGRELKAFSECLSEIV